MNNTLKEALIAIKNGIDQFMELHNQESEYIVLNERSHRLLEPAIYKNKLHGLRVIIDITLFEDAMILPATHNWQISWEDNQGDKR